MTDEAPDLQKFCFDPEAPATPDVMLVVWAKTFLTPEQFTEFRRMIHEIAAEQPGTKASVKQMIGIIEMAKFLAG